MIEDDEYPAGEEQGPGPTWAPRTANGGDLTSLGQTRLMSMTTRPPQPAPNAGGHIFAPQAGPGENANGAYAMTLPSAPKANAGGPSVAPQVYSPFGNYSGTPREPRPASIPTQTP